MKIQFSKASQTRKIAETKKNHELNYGYDKIYMNKTPKMKMDV